MHEASVAAAWLDSSQLRAFAQRAAYRHGLHGEDARDVLQDLRIALWKAGPDRSVNATWLAETANHKAADISRQLRRGAAVPLSEKHDPMPGGSDPELLPLLRARANALPARLRTFYALRFLEGLSEREIASRLGVCRSSVRNLELRCLKMVAGREVARRRVQSG